MNKDIERIFVSAEEIDGIVTRIAGEIDRDYKDNLGKLVLLTVLKGSIPFTADLMKKITLPVEIECVKVSSYGSGTVSSGKLNIHLDFNRPDISECDIIIIEDILDSGRTLTHLVEHLREKGAKSVRTAVLLDKPARRKVEFTPDYLGKVIPDEFVVGYGLDYDEKYRALPYVGVLHPWVYEGK